MNRVEAYQFLLQNLTRSKQAKALLCGVLEIKREDYIRDPHAPLSLEAIIKIKEASVRTNQGEPLSKIIGKREFWGLEFKTTKDTLDPRPETEMIIEQVLEKLPQDQNYRFLELGVGTGCLIISLLKEYEKAHGVGVDISLEALSIAQENLKTHALDIRLRLLQSSWFENISGTFDLIVSNPPYIEQKDIENLDICVKDYDPRLALDGGVDGLDCYRKIASDARSFLNDQGMIVLEIGKGQAEHIIDIFTHEGFHLLHIKRDLSGIERILSFTL